MRTITTTTTLYHYDELSDDAKEAVLDRLYDINIDHYWWDPTYEDAERVGIIITAFDLSPDEIDASIPDPYDTCRLILRDHGKGCDTHVTARQQLREYVHAEWRWYKENRTTTEDLRPSEFRNYYEDEYLAWSEETAHALREDYLAILRAEYEYLTSEEAIVDTINANEYEFTKDGTLS